MGVDEGAGTLGRSDTFLTSSKCPPPNYRGKGRQVGGAGGKTQQRTVGT